MFQKTFFVLVLWIEGNELLHSSVWCISSSWRNGISSLGTWFRLAD